MKAYDSAPVERPGCVTIYAILYWLVAAVYIIVAMLGGASLISDSIGGSVVLLICGLLLSAIPIGIGIGLWQMKKWAWALVVVFQSLGVLGALLGLLGLFAAADMAEVIYSLCSTTIGLLISGGILYWFITNRHLFDPPKYVMGPEGTMIEKSGDNTAVIVVVAGAVVIMCLIPIAIIAILTLLGPQIGEVFSRIVEELGTPMP